MNIAEFLQKQYGIDPLSIKEIKDGVIDTNYLVQSPDAKFIFKIVNTRNAKELQFELDVMKKLEKNDFPCPRVVQDLNGSTSAEVFGKLCFLLQYIEGEVIKTLTTNQFAKIGEQLAWMHTIFEDEAHDNTKATYEPDDLKRYIEQESENIIARNYPGAKDFVGYVMQEMGQLEFPNQLPHGVTHQDVKPGNIVSRDSKKLHFIDFDACYYGILLYDVLTSVIYAGFTDNMLQIDHLNALLSGYQSKRKLTEKEKNHLYDALRFRLLREAFVWPMRNLDEKQAEKYGHYFLKCYKNLVSSDMENKIKELV